MYSLKLLFRLYIAEARAVLILSKMRVSNLHWGCYHWCILLPEAIDPESPRRIWRDTRVCTRRF